jgi:hypothetical protein
MAVSKSIHQMRDMSEKKWLSTLEQGDVTVTYGGKKVATLAKYQDAQPNAPPLDPGTPAQPTLPTPNPSAKYPADVLNLTAWKVTLPKTKDGKVVEIFQPALATYSDEFFSLNAARTGIKFKVFHGGGTTSNSSNPRSELREMLPDGSNEFEWSTKTGTSSMEIRGKVNRLTKVKPHVVIAQIHDGDDDLSVFRVEGDSLYITDGDNTHAYLVSNHFELNTEYTIKFEVSGGKVSYYYNGQKVPFTLSTSDTSVYFKAGNYLQSNPKTAPSESPSEYSEVEILDLKVSHA